MNEDMSIASPTMHSTTTGFTVPKIRIPKLPTYSGVAYTWLMNLEQELGPHSLTWNHLKTSLLDYFKPTLSVRESRDRLANLIQTTTVEKYIDAFIELSIEIPDLSEAEKLDRFVR
ncbi:hypothetical protein EC973_009052, partial [Apophysomyces ossiformis]